MKKLVSIVLTLLLALSALTFVSAEGVIDGKSSWSVSATSEMTSVLKAFDGDTGTYWHSKYTAEGGTIVDKDSAPFYITIALPMETVISGWQYTPRQDNANGTVLSYKLFASERMGGDKKLIWAGELAKDQTVKTISFDADVKVSELVLCVLDGVGGYGTMAEFDLLSGDTGKQTSVDLMAAALAPEYGNEICSLDDSGNPTVIGGIKRVTELSGQSKWKVSASSEQTPIKNAFDGSTSSFWHSKYTAENGQVLSHEEPPFTIDIVFPEDMIISGFVYKPRDSGNNGIITGMDIYGSETETGELTKMITLTMERNQGVKKKPFTSNVKVRKIQLIVTEGLGGYGVAGEFNFLSEDENKELVSIPEFAAYEEEHMLYEINPDGFAVDDDCEVWAGHNPQMIFDHSPDTFWQTEPSGFPYTLEINMNHPTTVSSFAYTPRPSSDTHGCWIAYNVYASLDGKDFEKVCEVTDSPVNLDTKTVELEKSVTAQYWTFEIVDAFAKRASCGELQFFQTKADRDAEKEANHECYVLTIGKNTIDVTKGATTYTKELDVSPFIDVASSSTLIPLRGLLEEMGAEIEWEDKTQTVTVKKSTGNITMQIRNSLVYVEDPMYGTVRYTLRVVPKIKDSRTFIPLRFVSEHLGYSVEWNGDTQTITIEK